MAWYFHILNSSVRWSKTLEFIFHFQDLAKAYVNLGPTTKRKVFGPQDSLKYMIVMCSCSLPLHMSVLSAKICCS